MERIKVTMNKRKSTRKNHSGTKKVKVVHNLPVLPYEIWDMIINFMPVNYKKFYWQTVCKEWRDKFILSSGMNQTPNIASKFYLRNIFCNFLLDGYFNLAKYILEFGGRIDLESINRGLHAQIDEKFIKLIMKYEERIYEKKNLLVSIAAWTNSLELLKKIVQKYVPFDRKNNILVAACSLGNVEMLAWGLNKNCNIKNCYNYAAQNGHLHIIKYGIDNTSFAWNSKNISAVAAKYGHIEILEYLDEINWASIDKNTALSAVEGNQIKILKWLYAKGGKWLYYPNKCLAKAISNGNFEIINFLIKKKVKFPKDGICYLEASKNGNFHLLDKMLKKGIPLPKSATDKIFDNQYYSEKYCLDFVKWLNKNGFFNENIVDNAISCKAYHIVKWIFRERISLSQNSRTLWLLLLNNRANLVNLYLDYNIPNTINLTFPNHFVPTQTILKLLIKIGYKFQISEMNWFFEKEDLDLAFSKKLLPLDLHYVALKTGNINLLNWAKDNGGFKFSTNFTIFALKHNMVEFAIQNGSKWGTHLMKKIAKRGDVESLIKARKYKCEWDHITTLTAAKYGHTIFLLWAINNGCPVSSLACSEAIINNHLDTFNSIKSIKWSHDNYIDLVEYYKNEDLNTIITKLECLVSNNCPIEIPPRKTILYQRHSLTCYIASIGNIDLMKWAIQKGFKLGIFTTFTALKYSQIEMFNYLISVGSPWNENLCAIFSKTGNLTDLMIAREYNCPWNDTVLVEAIINNQTDIFNWAKLNGCIWNHTTATKFLNNKDILNKLLLNGCPLDNCAIVTIILRKYQDTLSWIINNTTLIGPNFAAFLAKMDYFNVLKIVIKTLNCSWDERVCKIAAKKANLKLLKWAKENGAPWDSRTTEKAAKKGYLNILKWALEHECPHDKQFIELHISRYINSIFIPTDATPLCQN